MNKRVLSLAALAVVWTIQTASSDRVGAESAPTPAIQSMSALHFAPDGTLFVGDGKGGAVWSLDLGGRQAKPVTEGFELGDLEGRIGALLGTDAEAVMVHDLAVHPVSSEIFLAVSRGRAAWDSSWYLPNDLADATILLAVDGDGAIREVSLTGIDHARAALPNPIDGEKKHRWKDGISLRADTVTDLALSGDTLFVAGLSNEEFASTMWRIPYPFADTASATALEIYHGAHGAYETHAPIRTFVPFELGGKAHILAAYLCTPFVTFEVDGLQAGGHLRGRTVAEFGSGNFPLDMVAYRKDGSPRLLIANTDLPLTIVDPADIEGFDGEILAAPDTYVAGIPFEIRSGSGIAQLDLLGDEGFVALERRPGGTAALVTMPVERF